MLKQTLLQPNDSNQIKMQKTQNIKPKLVICLLIFYILVIQSTSGFKQSSKSKLGVNDDIDTEIIRSEDIKGSTALDNFPLVDGHNDLPWILVTFKQNQLKHFDFRKNLSNAHDFNCLYCDHTDLPKLRAGKVGGMFWAAYVNCEFQYKDAVSFTLEQIDVIKRFVNKYSKDLEFVTTADGIVEAFHKQKIASLIGVEGGHSIEYKLSILRTYYELGVRYMTLTHKCSTPWADASVIDMKSVLNLTEFGKKVVLEMNRLGMMVDLSHVSHNVMDEVLRVTQAPVIFSHSAAHAIHAHHRNVRDDILEKLASNRGVIMINFYEGFVGDGNSTIETITDHINHVVDICGTDCVGIGTDYNGVAIFPKGLENISKFPSLFDLLRELNSTRWTIGNLEKLAGRNVVRVFKAVEQVRDSLKRQDPIEDWIPEADLNAVNSEVLKQCTTIPKKDLNHTFTF